MNKVAKFEVKFGQDEVIEEGNGASQEERQEKTSFNSQDPYHLNMVKVISSD
jgi:hypothetical protein